MIGVIMAYNKNTLDPDQAPRSWADALKPEFAGRKLILQDAAAGTAFAQMYELERHLGADYLKRLSAQKPMVVSTSAQVIDLLVRGEALVGFTVDHYRAFEPDAVKAGIIPIYPSEGMPIALAPIAIFMIRRTRTRQSCSLISCCRTTARCCWITTFFRSIRMRRDVPPPQGQLPYLATRSRCFRARPSCADYEHALSTFPERFEALFQSS